MLQQNIFAVLILVLMEDTLRVLLTCQVSVACVCLNPCFNGRYSQSPSIYCPLCVSPS